MSSIHRKFSVAGSRKSFNATEIDGDEEAKRRDELEVFLTGFLAERIGKKLTLVCLDLGIYI